MIRSAISIFIAFTATAAITAPAAHASGDYVGTPIKDSSEQQFMARSLAAAAQYWNVATPPGCAAGETPTVLASPNLGVAVEAATYIGTTCTIYENQDVFGLDSKMPWYTDAALCTIIVHEYGHLLGYGHTPEGSHTMMTPYSGDRPDAPQCADAADFWFPAAKPHRHLTKLPKHHRAHAARHHHRRKVARH